MTTSYRQLVQPRLRPGYGNFFIAGAGVQSFARSFRTGTKQLRLASETGGVFYYICSPTQSNQAPGFIYLPPNVISYIEVGPGDNLFYKRATGDTNFTVTECG